METIAIRYGNRVNVPVLENVAGVPGGIGGSV
jgi:hypothetical protein